jgi:transposase
MRGRPPKQTSMLCLLNVEDRVPQEHPLRPIKALADSALRSLSRTFEQAYAKKGRPSIPPERLLKGMLLIALYSIRSEVQFCEQLRYNLLFRWFIDMDLVEEPFDHSAFSDNRARLIEHDVARMFFRAVVNKATAAGLMSSEHFSVDGTLIEAWASMKSFRPKDEHDAGDSNGWSDFRGEKRSNETHESKSDPEARIFRKGNGKEAKLVFMGHALMENRNGLIKDLRITTASGRAEREAAVEMIDACRSRGVTRHAGYSASQQVRKRSEQIFGWLKVIGGMRKTRFKGRERNQLLAYMTGTAYNLLRIAKLMAATG